MKLRVLVRSLDFVFSFVKSEPVYNSEIRYVDSSELVEWNENIDYTILYD